MKEKKTQNINSLMRLYYLSKKHQLVQSKVLIVTNSEVFNSHPLSQSIIGYYSRWGDESIASHLKRRDKSQFYEWPKHYLMVIKLYLICYVFSSKVCMMSDCTTEKSTENCLIDSQQETGYHVSIQATKSLSQWNEVFLVVRTHLKQMISSCEACEHVRKWMSQTYIPELVSS